MVTLRRKAWRDLKENKGVYSACVVVIAIGLMIYTMMSIVFENMNQAQQDFYSQTHFADGFVKVTGYPENKLSSLTSLPGVDQAEGRIVKDVRLFDQQKDSNRYLRMVSMTMSTPPALNQVHLLTGHLPKDNQSEILVDSQFLAANHLAIGDPLNVVIEGQKATFYITGTAQSPEFIYIMKNAQDLYPSPADFGIAYVPLSSFKALVKEKGQFNDLVFTLKKGANFETVKDNLQAELKSFGVQSIVSRKDQTSNAVLTNEIKGIKTMATTLPVVFLGVASFILYTMLRRLMEQQRLGIGTLKAFGFTNREIVGHYLTFPLVIGTAGGLLGSLSGIALSFPLTTMYKQYFALPGLQSAFSFKYLFIGLVLSLCFSLLSGLRGSLDLLRLEPAQAMRPPAPLTARKTLIENMTWFWKFLSVQTQMGIRDLFRTPMRSLFNVLGLAVVFSLMTVSWSMQNMINLLTVVQLEKVQTYDVKLQLVQPSSTREVELALSHEAGVSKVEPVLEVPVTMKNGWLSKEVVLMGLDKDTTLYNILDKNGQRVEIPDRGILLSERLANILNAKVGDAIEVESPMRRDPLGEKGESLQVKGVVPQYVGLNAFIEEKELQRFLRFLIVGGLVILGLGAVAAAKFAPLSAKVLTLYPQDFKKGFTEEGQIIAAEEWPVFNQVEGKLQTLKVKNGDAVHKGQVLFEINTSDLDFQLEGLKAQLASLEGQRLQNDKGPDSAQIAQQKLIIKQAEKDAQTAERNLTRMKALADAGAISKSQLEEAQAASDKAVNYLAQQSEGLKLIYEQNQVSPGTEQYYNNQEKMVQAQINQLEDKKSKAVEAASQDGIVKDLSLKEGNVIPLGQQVMTVYGSKGYKLESFVLASDAMDIKAGSPVQIVQATGTGNRQFSGKVETIDSSAVEKVSPLGLKENRVKVTIMFDNPSSSAMVLGSSVDVKYTSVEVPGKLLVPKTALFPYQQGEAVWVLRQGKASLQPVKTGLENNSDVIVEQGLTKGDSILLDPNLPNLQEGKRVKAAV